jgi:hypothetical protein
MKARTSIIAAFLVGDTREVARILSRDRKALHALEVSLDPARYLRQMAYEAKSTALKLYQHSKGCPEWLQRESIYRRGRLPSASRYVFWTPFRTGNPVAHFGRESGASLCGLASPRCWGRQPLVITCRRCRFEIKRRGHRLDRWLTPEQMASLKGGDERAPCEAPPGPCA